MKWKDIFEKEAIKVVIGHNKNVYPFGGICLVLFG